MERFGGQSEAKTLVTLSLYKKVAHCTGREAGGLSVLHIREHKEYGYNLQLFRA
jgi:hypothetical protein